MAEVKRCRSCHGSTLRPFLSLGSTPLADALVAPGDWGGEERFPLEVAFCVGCSLVQLLEELPPQRLFVDNYLYFSSFSDDVQSHSSAHAEELVTRRGLDGGDLVVEIASNDGYLLRHFASRGVRVLGIDPAPDQAAAAEAAGIPTLREFFGPEVAARLRHGGERAEVVIAKNVMAHVPDLNGFVAAMATLLADDGEIHVENPYVVQLIANREFDTIYHEHLCYFSCTAVAALARRNGLWLNDVVEFPRLHGGTLRWVLGLHHRPSEAVGRFLEAEREGGVTAFDHYAGFADEVARTSAELRSVLTSLRSEGARIAGYGAAAKGSTLLNAVGIDTDLVSFVVDRNRHKHGLCMPGTHQPIRDPSALLEERPDYVLLLAWNFKEEIMLQQQPYLDGGGRFIVPVPSPQVVP